MQVPISFVAGPTQTATLGSVFAFLQLGTVLQSALPNDSYSAARGTGGFEASGTYIVDPEDFLGVDLTVTIEVEGQTFHGTSHASAAGGQIRIFPGPVSDTETDFHFETPVVTVKTTIGQLIFETFFSDLDSPVDSAKITTVLRYMPIGTAGDDHLYKTLLEDGVDFIGGSGFDFADYSQVRFGGVTVHLDHPEMNSAGAAHDTYDSVEGLIGTRAADVLVGNDGDNVLRGGGGNDILGGGGGIDIALYEGARDRFDVTFDPVLGTYTVRQLDGSFDGEGTDTLIDIEQVRFADKIFLLHDMVAAVVPSFPVEVPTAPATPTIITSGATSPLSSLALPAQVVASAVSTASPLMNYSQLHSAPAPEHLNPVFRFFETTTGEHFYTTSTVERDQIVANLKNFSYEGAQWATPDAGAQTQDVFRFYSTLSNTHFYTTSTAEKDAILATLPHYRFEGVAFQTYADGVSGDGVMQLERFFNTASGVHHYAVPPGEVEGVRQGSAGPNWADEGASLKVHVITADLFV